MNSTLPKKQINSPLSQVSSLTDTPSSGYPSKRSSQNYIRTTFYVPRNLHKQLKMVAAQRDRDMSGIVEELLKAWLPTESNPID